MSVSTRLLTHSARLIERQVVEGTIARSKAADVTAIEAGFPAWTGGPITGRSQTQR